MSVEFQKLRADLMRDSLAHGWTKPSEVSQVWRTDIAPERLERWFKRLYKAPEAPLPVAGRLVNHFMLGADPEFVLSADNTRVDAYGLGLKAGPAFGADNNGRLVELRAHPSRSALTTLASLWLAMRWMPVCVSRTADYAWRGGAYFEGDGLGGHIHFGRKRTKLRDREIASLDRIAHLTFAANVFDRDEGRMRVRHSQGAPHGHKYGELGDTRRQPHGYEYRTFPSWIDTPWLAYFMLVVSKLVVAFPDMVPPLTESDHNLSIEQARAQLRFLLAYYAPQDDDARLAFAILNAQGFPKHAAGLDIKAGWGIFPSAPFGNAEVERPDYVPSTIPPRAEDEQELANSMFEGRIPELPTLTPTWKPSKLPKDYVALIDTVQTRLAPGLGEFCMGLAIMKGTFAITGGGSGSMVFRLPCYTSAALKNAGFKFRGYFDHGAQPNNIIINTSKEVSLDLILEGRQALLESGVYPIWDVSEVTAKSYEEWQNRQPRQVSGPKYLMTTRGSL